MSRRRALDVLVLAAGVGASIWAAWLLHRILPVLPDGEALSGTRFTKSFAVFTVLFMVPGTMELVRWLGTRYLRTR